MPDDTIESIVHGVLRDEFELDGNDIHAAARLQEDLELDSLDRVDLIVTLEKALGVRFAEDQTKDVRTVADLVATVERIRRSTPARP